MIESWSNFRFFFDVKELRDFCNHLSELICHLDLKFMFGFRVVVGRLLDGEDLLLGEFKASPDRPASRALVLDARTLVPDDVVPSQVLDQHQHEKRIGHGIKGAPEVGPHVVAIPEAETHFDLDQAEVWAQGLHPDPSTQEGRPEAHPFDQGGLFHLLDPNRG